MLRFVRPNYRLSFGLSAILLGTGSSMNNNQPYGKGWMRGKCYIVKDGVYAGSAVLVAATIIFIIGFTFTSTTRRRHRTKNETISNKSRPLPTVDPSPAKL